MQSVNGGNLNCLGDSPESLRQILLMERDWAVPVDVRPRFLTQMAIALRHAMVDAASEEFRLYVEKLAGVSGVA